MESEAFRFIYVFLTSIMVSALAFVITGSLTRDFTSCLVALEARCFEPMNLSLEPIYRYES